MFMEKENIIKKVVNILKNILGGFFVFIGLAYMFSGEVMTSIVMMLFGISLTHIFYEKIKLTIKHIQIILPIILMIIFIIVAPKTSNQTINETQKDALKENTKNVVQDNKEVEEQAKKEAEEQAKKEAEEQAKKEAEEQAKKEAEEQAKKEAEEQAKKEAEIQKQTTTTTIQQSNSSSQSNKNNTHGQQVYRTPSGKRYHFDPDCGGKNSYQTTLDAAKSSGLTPCQKCAK